MQIIRMPKMGQTMESGTVVAWEVGEGDGVTEDEVLAVIESEKTSADVPATQDGTVARIDVDEGEEVPPGTVLGIVLGPDEELSDAPAPRTQTSPEQGEPSTATNDGSPEESEAPSSAAVAENQRAPEEDDRIDVSEPESGSPTTDTGDDDGERAQAGSDRAESTERQFASPTTRRLAREMKVPLDEFTGSGPGGSITKQDILDASNALQGGSRGSRTGGESRSQGSTGPARARDGEITIAERRELTGVRATVARRMAESHANAPHVTLNREVAVESALGVAQELSTDRDVGVGFNDILIAAVSQALTKHPEFNAWFDGEIIEVVQDINIALAVDTEAGLLTPVMRNVASRSVSEIAWERRRITNKVLDGEHTVDDLQGGTFTVTNLGMFGVTSFDPIINPPQVAILGVGRFRETGTETECTLSLSFDHRVVDGADAARFLSTIVSGVESPTRLVIDQVPRAARPGETLLSSTGEAGGDVASTSTAGAGKQPITTSSASEGGDRGPEDAIASSIVSMLDTLAGEYGWDAHDFSVSLHTDEGMSISVEAAGEITPATLRRLSFAACREVGHQLAIESLFDPDLSVSLAG